MIMTHPNLCAHCVRTTIRLEVDAEVEAGEEDVEAVDRWDHVNVEMVEVAVAGRDKDVAFSYTWRGEVEADTKRRCEVAEGRVVLDGVEWVTYLWAGKNDMIAGLVMVIYAAVLQRYFGGIIVRNCFYIRSLQYGLYWISKIKD